MAEGDPDLERISGSEPLPASLEPARPKAPVAWEPVTPRGVAAFALARWGRYWLVALAVALAAAVVVVWFVGTVWAPIVLEAIRALPATGRIERQVLTSPRLSPEPLAINSFLGMGLDVERRSNVNVGADIYVKLQRSEALVCSFLGCVVLPYPAGWTIQVNRPELEPWWGAWKPILLGLLFLGVTALLMSVWLVLGLIYAPIVWLVARSGGRKLTGGACWRLGAASNLPGALLLSVMILGYGLRILNVQVFCVMAVAHIVPAWIYLFICPRHVPAERQPRRTTPQAGNPFEGGGKPAGKSGNLFRPEG